jgi:hypothetical protein
MFRLPVRLLQTEGSEDGLLNSSAIRAVSSIELLVAANSDDGTAVASILRGLPKGELEYKDPVSEQRSNNVDIGRNKESLLMFQAGKTALYLAAEAGYSNTVTVLVHNNADVNCCDQVCRHFVSNHRPFGFDTADC